MCAKEGWCRVAHRLVSATAFFSVCTIVRDPPWDLPHRDISSTAPHTFLSLSLSQNHWQTPAVSGLLSCAATIRKKGASD